MGTAKKVIDFIAMRPALTTRNMTSIGLVCLLFAVYILAGGRVTSVPTVKARAGFGGAHVSSATVDADDNLMGDVQPAARNVFSSPKTHSNRVPTQTAPAPETVTRPADTSHGSKDQHGSSLSDLQKRLNRIAPKDAK